MSASIAGVWPWQGWSPSRVGRAAWLAIGLAIGIPLAVLLLRPAPMPFAAFAVAWLAVAAYAAHRWPHATLVAAAVVTLADLVLTPRFLPASLRGGPIGASEPLLAVTGLVIGVDAIRAGRFVTALRDPVVPLALAFVGVSVVSMLVNGTPVAVAAFGTLMTLDAMAIYFVWRMLPAGLPRSALAIGGIVAAALIAAVFGLGQVLLHPNLLGFASFQGQYSEGGRITSFLGNPNMLAPVIGFALPFAVYGCLSLPERGQRWVAGAVAFVLILALLFTFSRGSWLAVGLGTLVGGLLLDRRALLVLVLMVPLAWGTGVVLPKNLAVSGDAGEEVTEVEALDVFGGVSNRVRGLRNEGDLRMRFLTDGLRVVQDNWLLGVGPGRYGGAAAAIIPSPVYREYDTGLFGQRTVHNFWLHLAGEVGVLGAAIFVAMIGVLLVRFIREAWRSEGIRRVLLAGIATATLVVVFNNATEMSLEGNVPAILIWLMLGIGSTLMPAGMGNGIRPIRRSAA